MLYPYRQGGISEINRKEEVMNNREMLMKTALEPNVPDEKLELALRILQGRDIRKQEVSGYLSVRDIAKYLGGVSRVHLWHLRNNGLPYYNLGGRILFKTAEIESWMAANCKPRRRRTQTQDMKYSIPELA